MSLANTLYSEEPQWINYTNGDIITVLVEEGEFIWVGTNGGVIKINKSTKETVFYNSSNSGLPDNRVTSISIDDSGNKWIGTSTGLVKFMKMNQMFI